MRFAISLAIAAAVVIFAPGTSHAQAQPDTARKIEAAASS